MNCNGICNNITINEPNNNNNSSLSIYCYQDCTNLHINTPNIPSISIHISSDGTLQNSTINGMNTNYLSIDMIKDKKDNRRLIPMINNNIIAQNVYSLSINANIFVNNIISADNAQNVNLTFGTSENNMIHTDNVNKLWLNAQCSDEFDIDCYTKSSFIFAQNASDIHINNTNNNMVDTIFYGQIANKFNLSINDHGSIENCIFCLNQTQNVSFLIDSDSSSFSNNFINMTLSKYYTMINKGNVFNNSLIAINATLFNISCIESYTNCGDNDNWNVFDVESLMINMNPTKSITQENGILINGSNATNVNINIGKYATLKTGKIYSNNASSMTMNIYGTLQNVDIINIESVKTATINLGQYSEFSQNIIYAQFISKTLIVNIANNGYFHSNKLNLNTTNNVKINNLGNYYDNIIDGNNIKTEFNLSCSDNFGICGNKNDIFNLNNAQNVSLYIDSTQSRDLSFDTNINAKYAKFIDIYIGSEISSISRLTLNGEYSTNILTEIYGEIYDSVINGVNNKKNVSIVCSGKCSNLSLWTSPKYNLLKCINYGCDTINIFTRNTANDIDMTCSECPCDDNIKNSCINNFNLFCDTNYSLNTKFNGGKNCDGDCCGNIVNMMHENNCPWNDDDDDTNNGNNADTDSDTNGNNNNKSSTSTNGNDSVWIIYLIIGALIFLFIASGIIICTFYVNKKKRRKRDEKINKMEFVSVNNDITKDSTVLAANTPNSPKVKKPQQKL